MRCFFSSINCAYTIHFPLFESNENNNMKTTHKSRHWHLNLFILKYRSCYKFVQFVMQSKCVWVVSFHWVMVFKINQHDACLFWFDGLMLFKHQRKSIWKWLQWPSRTLHTLNKRGWETHTKKLKTKHIIWNGLLRNIWCRQCVTSFDGHFGTWKIAMSCNPNILLCGRM